MKIVFIAHFAGSLRHGMVFGHYYLAREWVKLGHDVTIVASSFAHTRTLQPDEKCKEEMIDGIRYVWVKSPTYSPSNRLGRVLNIMTFTLKTWLMFPEKEADVIICSSHHPFAIHSAKKWARKLSARLIFEVRDLWPLTLIELGGASKENPFIRLMQFSENYAYRQSDQTVSVLANSYEYMKEHGLSRSQFNFIPNGISLDECDAKDELPHAHLDQLMSFREKHGFVVGYAGRIGLANALSSLVDAVHLAKGEVGVVILGDGSHLNELKEKVNELSISEDVLFLSAVKKPQVQSFLEKVDAAYIGLQSHPLFRYGVSPTKINDYMLAAKPIVCAIDTPNSDVHRAKSGYQCIPEDPQSVCDAMIKLKRMSSDERATLGENGKRWLTENKDYRGLAKQFIKVMES